MAEEASTCKQSLTVVHGPSADDIPLPGHKDVRSVGELMQSIESCESSKYVLRGAEAHSDLMRVVDLPCELVLTGTLYVAHHGYASLSPLYHLIEYADEVRAVRSKCDTCEGRATLKKHDGDTQHWLCATCLSTQQQQYKPEALPVSMKQSLNEGKYTITLEMTGGLLKTQSTHVSQREALLAAVKGMLIKLPRIVTLAIRGRSIVPVDVLNSLPEGVTYTRKTDD